LFLLSLGQTQEALREFERAVDMNPHSMTANRFLVNGLIAARRYKEGLAKAKKTAELGDGFSGVPNHALLWCGEVDESITVNEQLAIASGKPAAEAHSQATELRRAFKEEGIAAFWNKRLEFMRQNEVGIVALAGACAAAGRLEESLDLLEQAYREHHDWLVWDVATHPTWDNLRGQPRFQELLRKLRLEQGRVGSF
jgi:tetratricopeptide (TPR) repeat protein